MIKRIHGFTLVEIVTVVVILSIIGAIALPRMYSFITESNTVAAEGIWKVFSDGITDVVARQDSVPFEPGTNKKVVFRNGYFFMFNTSGYPVAAGTNKSILISTYTGVTAPQDCVNLWNAIIQPVYRDSSSNLIIPNYSAGLTQADTNCDSLESANCNYIVSMNNSSGTNDCYYAQVDPAFVDYSSYTCTITGFVLRYAPAGSPPGTIQRQSLSSAPCP